MQMPTFNRREFLGASASALAAQTGKSAKPNIIIFFVDELRATALKLYDPNGIETPNLARLAKQGVLFQNVFTPHPLCMPARACLWTGQYSKTNGSRDNELPLRDDRETMAGALHDAGYKLGLFGKNHVFTPAQLKRWFDVDHSYAANTTAGENALNRGLSPEIVEQMDKHEAWIREQAGRPTPSPFPKEVFTTHVTNQRAMDFIEGQAGGPFAAWISILDPHPPMQVPEEFARMYPPDQIKLPALREGEMKTKNTRMQIFDYQVRGSELPEKFLRQYLSIYYGMIAFIDSELGRLMDSLVREHDHRLQRRPWRLRRRASPDLQIRQQSR